MVDSPKINQWLALAANIGVLIGLILLILELKQNNELTKVQVTQMRSDSLVERRWGIAESSEIAPLLAKLRGMGYPKRLVSRDELTDVETERLHHFLAVIAFDAENLFYQKQQGYIDQEYWDERIVPSIKAVGKYFEEYVGDIGRPEFEAEVARLIDESE